MRGLREAFVVTALLAVRILASELSRAGDSSADLVHSLATINLNLQTTASEIKPITLYLESQPSENLCDVSKVTVQGEVLKAIPARKGDAPLSIAGGPIRLDDDSIISAYWTYTCDPSPQTHPESANLELDLAINGYGGKELFSETKIKAIIRQGETPKIPTVVSPSLSKEVEFSEWVLVDVETPPSHSGGHKSKEKCHTLKCLFNTVTEKAEAAADRLYGDMMKAYGGGKAASDEDYTIITSTPGHNKMKPITKTASKSPPSTSSAIPSATPTARFLHDLPPPDPDLVMTLTVAAFAFLAFSIIGIAAGTRRLAPHIQRRPRDHRETREERLARLAERRRAARNFFSSLFCGIFGYEEKDAQEPQGRDLRDGGSGAESGQQQGDDDTTMEQELANFRNAADMVSSMIAAEEGRSNAVIQRIIEEEGEPRAPPPEVPGPIQAAYPGYFPGESMHPPPPPPSYENDEADGSIVADGFRYTPGETTPSYTHPMDDDLRNSDRLGYGNKD